MSNSQNPAELDKILLDLPALETERLLLRKLHLEDAEDMFEYAVDPELAGLGMWLPFHTIEDSRADLEETLRNYAKGELVDWAIVLKAEAKMIGRAGLGRYSPRNYRAELGYALNRRYWGKGYMTEAAQVIMAFGFGALGLHRIEANVLSENSASIHILEKLGMQYEGVKREATFVRNRFDDVKLYAILSREWAGNPPK